MQLTSFARLEKLPQKDWRGQEIYLLTEVFK